MRARSDDSRERRLPGGVIGLAAVAVLLSFVAVVIALTRHENPPVTAQPQPAPTPTTAPVQPTAVPTLGKDVASETLHLVVDASPREARVYLDDVLLTGHPVNQILHRDGKPHQVRVEAAGYRPRLEKFDATGDTRLIMSLELLPPKTPPPPPRPEEIYP